MSSDRAAGRGSEDPWIAVARILRPHGLGGTLRLQPFSRSPDELLDAPNTVFHVRRGEDILGPYTLEATHLHGAVILADFKEIPDRTAAEKLTNAELVVREEELWSPPADSYFIHDLQGLEVRESETGRALGRVRTAQEGAAHDYLILDLDQKRGVMLPLLPMFVPVVDIESGFVEVVIPPGLLD